MSNDNDSNLHQHIHDAYDSVQMDASAKDAMLARLQAYQAGKLREGEVAPAQPAHASPTITPAATASSTSAHVVPSADVAPSAPPLFPDDFQVVTAPPLRKRKHGALPAAAAAAVVLFAIIIGVSAGSLFVSPAKDSASISAASPAGDQEAPGTSAARTDSARADESPQASIGKAAESSAASISDNETANETAPSADSGAVERAVTLGAVPGNADDAEVARQFPIVQSSSGILYELVWQDDAPLTIAGDQPGAVIETVAVSSTDGKQEAEATVLALPGEESIVAVSFEGTSTLFIAFALPR